MGKVFQFEINSKTMEEVLDDAYNQGVDHAMKMAKTISLKKYDSIEAFLLELSIELNKLKEPKKEKEPQDAN